VADTVADIGEFGLLDRLRAAIPTPVGARVGIGDDAAVVDVAAPVVIGVDAVVEDRHFRHDWVSADDVGHRAAAAAMADVAAMGGTPAALLVAVTVPPDTTVDWVTELLLGINDEAEQVGAGVVGGDLTRGDSIVVSVTAMGSAEQVVRRDGAEVGDVVAIAGRQGWAAAGLTVLSRGFRSPRSLVQAYGRPHPPYDSGPAAAAAGATAMIDVSDGLMADIAHLARASGVVVDLESELIPVADQLQETSSAFNVDPLTWVLAGGDDHSLVAAFPAGTALPQMFTAIGRAVVPGTNGPGVAVDGRMWSGQGGGYDHFR